VRIFISWSGERSHAVARALRAWIPAVIPRVAPWLSTVDIGAGTPWSRSLHTALRKSRFGILCITPENQAAPWLMFEAGALAKGSDQSIVCPYLLGLEPSEITAGPLTLFQAKTATMTGTFDLVSAINSSLEDGSLSGEELRVAFRRYWPALAMTLRQLRPRPKEGVNNSRDPVLAELLLSVRQLLRRMPATSLDYYSDGFSIIKSEATPPTASEIWSYEAMSAADVAKALDTLPIDAQPALADLQADLEDEIAYLRDIAERRNTKQDMPCRGLPKQFTPFTWWAIAA
jgi:hypothetical protein